MKVSEFFKPRLSARSKDESASPDGTVFALGCPPTSVGVCWHRQNKDRLIGSPFGRGVPAGQQVAICKGEHAVISKASMGDQLDMQGYCRERACGDRGMPRTQQMLLSGGPRRLEREQHRECGSG